MGMPGSLLQGAVIIPKWAIVAALFLGSIYAAGRATGIIDRGKEASQVSQFDSNQAGHRALAHVDTIIRDSLTLLGRRVSSVEVAVQEQAGIVRSMGIDLCLHRTTAQLETLQLRAWCNRTLGRIP